MHSYAGKHEIQQHGDKDDVANGFDGDKHALDHMLSLKTNNDQLLIEVLCFSTSLRYFTQAFLFYATLYFYSYSLSIHYIWIYMYCMYL